jgi:hypothetical protein
MALSEVRAGGAVLGGEIVEQPEALHRPRGSLAMGGIESFKRRSVCFIWEITYELYYKQRLNGSRAHG